MIHVRKPSRMWPLAVLLTIVFALGGGYYTLQNASAREDNSYDQLKLFATVLDLVERNYVEPVDMKKLIYGAIQGMLQSLDPHSSFLKPDDYKELQIETKGNFTGIGIEITLRDGVLTVVSPIEGTPAYKAGIRANDKIVKIEDKSTKDMGLIEAVKLLRGPKGTKVTITIFREGWRELKDITLVRDVIPIKSVSFRAEEKDYGYVRISNFQNNTDSELKEALTSLEKGHHLKGIVLDLRNNPGGLLDQAVQVADEFLEKGLIVYTDGRIKEQVMEFEAHPNKDPHDYPIVLLVNEGSASASEIVAGALQDHHRAIIVGTQTFGKGSVQTIIPLEDGSAVRLTTALYYTPNGRSIQAKGIQPDIVVPYIPPESKNGNGDQKARFLKESDLEGHLPAVTDGKSKDLSKPPAEMQKGGAQTQEPPMDNQLVEALRILKAWTLFPKTTTE